MATLATTQTNQLKAKGSVGKQKEAIWMYSSIVVNRNVVATRAKSTYDFLMSLSDPQEQDWNAIYPIGEMNLLAILSFFILCDQYSSVFVHEDKKFVLGQVSEDVVLPCYFTPGENIVIHWQRMTPSTTVVHSYYKGKDHPEKQDKQYLNRTHLFQNEFRNGNASLKLRNLRLDDEEEYICYVGTNTDQKETKISLNVTAFKQFALNYDGQRKMLTCSAFGVHPIPNITWRFDDDSIVDIYKNLTKQNDGLNSLVSSINITKLKMCICKVQHGNLTWTGIWNKAESQVHQENHDAVFKCTSKEKSITDFTVTWSIQRKDLSTLLAQFNNSFKNLTREKAYEGRISSDINSTTSSILLEGLTFSDSGDYLCNISSPNYMQLMVIHLFVERETGRSHHGLYAATIPVIVLLILACRQFGKAEGTDARKYSISTRS
ncbi:HERV-H LTR-associating protein 2 isoform X2 [Lissotriton helveticus]